MAWKLAIRKVCPIHRMSKSKDHDQSSSHRLSAFCLPKKSTLKHNQTSWKEFINGVQKSETEFPIQDGRLQPQLDICHFHVEALMDTADFDLLNNFVELF